MSEKDHDYIPSVYDCDDKEFSAEESGDGNAMSMGARATLDSISSKKSNGKTTTPMVKKKRTSFPMSMEEFIKMKKGEVLKYKDYGDPSVNMICYLKITKERMLMIQQCQ